MDTREYTLAELKTQYEEMHKKSESLKTQIKQKEQEEEERKQAELALAKENRKKEVEAARDNYQKLLKAYIRDYGSISMTSDSDVWPSLFSNKPWTWWF